MRSLDPVVVHRWAHELALLGHEPTRLAAGVEGAVFRLGNGAVAKVWNSRTEDEIGRLASFYNAVGRAGLPFLVPEIRAVGRLSDAVFSVERELPGEPLWPDHTGQSPPLHTDAIADVLTGLAAVTPTDEMKLLPVFGETEPLWLDGGFDNGLAGLVARHAIPGFDSLAAAVVDRLSSLPAGRDCLIHGDLIPANILVEDGEVVALLDFGFLSTVGPAAFEAAVTVNIFDMYGPEREASRFAMAELVAERFGYAPEVLAVYLAAYALATMTMFGTSETDGHFRWCVEVLRRADVVAALGLS